MKHADYNITIKCNIKDLPDINVGNIYTIQSVNRTTGEVVINRYSLTDWNSSDKLMTAESFLKAIK